MDDRIPPMADGQQIPKLDIAPQVGVLSLPKIVLRGIVGSCLFPREIGIPIHVGPVLCVPADLKKEIHKDSVKQGNLNIAPSQSKDDGRVGGSENCAV